MTRCAWIAAVALAMVGVGVASFHLVVAFRDTERYQLRLLLTGDTESRVAAARRLGLCSSLTPAEVVTFPPLYLHEPRGTLNFRPAQMPIEDYVEIGFDLFMKLPVEVSPDAAGRAVYCPVRIDDVDARTLFALLETSGYRLVQTVEPPDYRLRSTVVVYPLADDPVRRQARTVVEEHILNDRLRVVKRLDDPVFERRKGAVWDVLTLGDDAEQAVPALIRLLRTDRRLRADVIAVLAELGPRASEAVPALLEVCESEGEAETLRSSARQAIERIAKQALPDA